jgi:hypothetical protein
MISLESESTSISLARPWGLDNTADWSAGRCAVVSAERILRMLSRTDLFEGFRE